MKKESNGLEYDDDICDSCKELLDNHTLHDIVVCLS